MAVEFLDAMFPGDPVHLVAIAEAKPLEAKSFKSADAARDWIEARQGKKNLYYHVNRLKSDASDRKARKEDIDAALFLHVDIDSLDALPELEKYSPRPTAVVASGGGFHGFWRLDNAVTDLDRVERVNAAIAEALGGDNCHNIDRIMRLPGTINLPNAHKRKAGRVAVMARLVEHSTNCSRRYTLGLFPELSTGLAASSNMSVGEIPGQVDLAALPDAVPEYVRGLIETGDDLDAPRGAPDAHFGSRSEAVFRVAIELIKAGCSVETVAGVLLDGRNGIAESVLEKGRSAKRYAVRQAKNALVAASHDWPDVGRSGKPRPSYANAVTALRRFEITGENDVFHQRRSIQGVQIQQVQGELSDDLVAVLRHSVLERFGFDPGAQNVRDAANIIALENTHHPIADYLNGLVWDGKPRLARWLSTYLGAEDTPLNQAIGARVLAAAVRRIREPGAKFDYIMVLEGEQGTGKSTAIRMLAGDDNFSDNDILTLDNRAQQEALQGVWLYEISELSGFNRTEITRIKAFASRQIDTARPAYAHFRERRPRQTILIGTTNEAKYLRDQTGNRRFWPVRTGRIDRDALARDRDQLWAEAVVVERKGISLTLPDDLLEAAAIAQADRMEDHPWHDVLAEITGHVDDGIAKVATNEIFDKLDMKPGQRQDHHSKTIARIMESLGWQKDKFRLNGKVVRGYRRIATEADLTTKPAPSI